MNPPRRLWAVIALVLLAPASDSAAGPPGDAPAAAAPRIVNVVNFVRGLEPRDPRLDLVEPVREQLRLARETGLPVTFLLQYDALVQSRFVDLIRAQAGDSVEVGAWLEIVQPLVEKAGLRWRGRFPWDWHVDVDFTVGYAPRERERLIDAYMDEFKSVFGRYPRTVGAWYIDALSLSYLARRYGVLATCMCREQVGNDGYTLWGGYWNGIYFPSRRNAFMPAQRAEHQIPIAVFRMSGNDPIDRFASGIPGLPSGVRTLEPACPEGGGSPEWVRWYLRMHSEAPCLALSHVQVGQENAFGWPRMANGLTDQMRLLAQLAAAGKVRVETMENTARWFASRYPVTPATAVVALEAPGDEARGSVWYSTRFYRVNFSWKDGSLRVSDLHRFDESIDEPFIAQPASDPACRFGTLALFDDFLWAPRGAGVGLRPVRTDPGAAREPLRVGRPHARELREGELELVWPIAEGGEFRAVCRESVLELRCVGGRDPERWALEMALGHLDSLVTQTSDRTLVIRSDGHRAVLRCASGRCAVTPDASGFLLYPAGDRLSLDLRGSD